MGEVRNARRNGSAIPSRRLGSSRDLVDTESGWGERPSGTSPSMRKEVPPAASAASAPQKRGRSRHAHRIRAAASVWEVEDAMTPWTHRSA
jgi:hypothetical protein